MVFSAFSVMSDHRNTAIGMPADRIEGRAKVTGSARYAADYALKNMAYAAVITSPAAKGRILSIKTDRAMNAPGVVAVLSHLNVPAVPGYQQNPMSAIPIFAGTEFKPFLDDKVRFAGQPVALVVAESIEQAQYGASLIQIQYEWEKHQTDLIAALPDAVRPEKATDHSRGDIVLLNAAPVIVREEYRTSLQVHNPMEPHATTAYWEGDDRLYIYNKSQGVKTTRQQFAKYFQLKEENVKVSSPYVGGAFGSSSRMWPQEMMAVLAAKKTGRPVQVALQRTQVFNMVGYRPYSIQRLAIGAQRDGSIVGIMHEAFGSTSRYEQFMERILEPTKSLYSCPNVTAIYKLVQLDMSTPCPARGPGETSGSFALESAMDELSYALEMDPLELRKKNFARADGLVNKPWSSNYLPECYALGAEKFGWASRSPAPRSMRRDDKLIGWGMSAGIYKAERAPASASVTLYAEGHVTIRCSVADTGPGSITILTQIAADALGIPLERVRIEWADADLPPAPPQYGSHTTASTGSAVHDAAVGLREKLGGASGITADLGMDGYVAVLRERGLPELSYTSESKPGAEAEKYSGKSFVAHFVEVEVEELTGQVRVKRVVSCLDTGKVMNPKTAHSQLLGAITWGIGIALMEEGLVDHRFGCYVNNNLADYHVPVNADFPDASIYFIDKPDMVNNPMGSKGIGEIGLVGLTAGIANAVYHATGRRIRHLPITPDKLIG